MFPLQILTTKKKLHLVREWLVEFDENDIPQREIALGENGVVIFSGPDNRNYGFWIDTKMKHDDFRGTNVDQALFEKLWRERIT